MGTIRELYANAFSLEQPFMLYGIYLLAEQNLIDWESDEETLNFDSLTFQEINAAIKENPLGMNVIRLYTMKIRDNEFAFILAKNEKEAVSEFKNVHHAEPVFTVDITNKIDTSMYDEKSKQYLSFQEIRNETTAFPHYVCDCEKDNLKTLEEIEYEYSNY